MSEKNDYCLLKYLFSFLPINDQLSYTYQLHKACQSLKQSECLCSKCNQSYIGTGYVPAQGGAHEAP